MDRAAGGIASRGGGPGGLTGTLRISVADDGAGLPEGFDPSVDARLGLQIVQTLVRDDLRGASSSPRSPTIKRQWLN